MMTSKTRKAKAKAPKLFPVELIDQLLAQVRKQDAESILGESGLAGQLKKRSAERMLAAELNHHLTTEVAQQAVGTLQRHQSEDGHHSWWRITPGYSS